MSCRNYDPCLDSKLNQIGSYASVARQSAQSATASAAAADSDATAAAASAAAAAASAEIAGIYLGPFATPPTVDNQGGPLQEGMLYYNTANNTLFVWNGSSWSAIQDDDIYLGGFAVAPVLNNQGLPLVLGNLYWNSVTNNLWAYNGVAWIVTNFNETTPFLATGTTTARNLATRFADVVNVKDFGAVGDGVADDTAAIQAAINAATGKQLILPSGTYKISGTLVLLNSIYIVGYGQCTLQQSQANTTIIRIGDGTLANRRGDFSIENITFTTTSSAAWTSAYVIDVQFAFFIEFKNLDIFGYVSSVKKMWGGIRLFKAMRFKAERCFMRGLIGDCVYTLGETGGLNYCIDLTFENCYFDDFVGNGFYFDDFTLGTFLYNCVMVSSVGNSLITYDISSSEKSNHYVYGLNAEAGGTMNGILINSASLVQIQNGWFQVGSTKNAIYLGPNATGIQIQGLWTTEGRWLIEGKNISITDGYIGSLLPDSSYAMTIDGASGKSNAVDIRSTTIDQFTGGGINLLNQPVRVSINGVRFFSVSQPYINGSNYTGGPIIEGVASDLQISGSQFVTAANTMSFGYGREMWQITGATLIQNITAQAPGRRLYLQAGTGGITFTTGGNIQFNTAALNQFNVVEFICDGTTWFEIGR